jgi:hypothetical protein
MGMGQSLSTWSRYFGQLSLMQELYTYTTLLSECISGSGSTEADNMVKGIPSQRAIKKLDGLNFLSRASGRAANRLKQAGHNSLANV